MVKYTALTDEEKDVTARIAKLLVEKAEQARREGILALEDGIDELSENIGGIYGEFGAKLLRYVVDGSDASVISLLAGNFMDATCESDFEHYCFTLITAGVLAIQRGDNPLIIEELFVSYTGLRGEADFRKRTGFDKNVW